MGRCGRADESADVGDVAERDGLGCCEFDRVADEGLGVAFAHAVGDGEPHHACGLAGRDHVRLAGEGRVFGDGVGENVPDGAWRDGC